MQDALIQNIEAMLIDAGVSVKKARHLAANHPADEIAAVIAEKSDGNNAGLLVWALEEGEGPAALKRARTKASSRSKRRSSSPWREESKSLPRWIEADRANAESVLVLIEGSERAAIVLDLFDRGLLSQFDNANGWLLHRELRARYRGEPYPIARDGNSRRFPEFPMQSYKSRAEFRHHIAQRTLCHGKRKRWSDEYRPKVREAAGQIEKAWGDEVGIGRNMPESIEWLAVSGSSDDEIFWAMVEAARDETGIVGQRSCQQATNRVYSIHETD